MLINTTVVCISFWASRGSEERKTLLRQGLYPKMLASQCVLPLVKWDHILFESLSFEAQGAEQSPGHCSTKCKALVFRTEPGRFTFHFNPVRISHGREFSGEDVELFF